MKFIPADNRPFEPASHELRENPGVWKRVIASRDELLAGQVQMINWVKLPVGSSFRAHYHEDMEEMFIVVDGLATMKCGDDEVNLGPGDTVVVAPREVHVMWNRGDRDVQYIVVGITLGQNGKTVVVE